MRELRKVVVTIGSATEGLDFDGSAVMTTRELASLRKSVEKALATSRQRREAEAAQLKSKLAELQG